MIQKETSTQGPPFEVEASLEVGILGQQMRFNKDSLTVKGGKNVELIFNNDDTLPLMHNLLLVKPQGDAGGNRRRPDGPKLFVRARIDLIRSQ